MPMSPTGKDEPFQPAEGAFSPAQLIRTEAAALEALAARLDGAMADSFWRAVDMIVHCGQQKGRVVVTGMGKSGIIAQKIAATLSSTGSPALFLHPAEAVHGDLGVLMPGDVVIALSASGETEEILRLLATVKRKGDALITFCCNLQSTLAAASDVALDCSVEREACGLNLAPTASTTSMLALGDALAVAVSLRKGFRAEDFAELHPGGKLGKQLAKVRESMHTGEDVPVVAPLTTMADVIFEMSSKKLGMTTVQESGRLRGVISDSNLRRIGARRRRGSGQDGRRGDERASTHDCRGRARGQGVGDPRRAQDYVARRRQRGAKGRRRCASARSVGCGADLTKWGEVHGQNRAENRLRDVFALRGHLPITPFKFSRLPGRHEFRRINLNHMAFVGGSSTDNCTDPMDFILGVPPAHCGAGICGPRHMHLGRNFSFRFQLRFPLGSS